MKHSFCQFYFYFFILFFEKEKGLMEIWSVVMTIETNYAAKLSIFFFFL